MPKVSVILPNYNHGQFLDERISSILCQTFADFELIILDDCSSDDSRSVIERYRAHSKVSHLVYNDTNSGSTFRQWHKGIELAKGQYIWIAESDDWCEPTLLETLVNGLNEKCVLAFCQSVVVGDERRILWNSRAEFLSTEVPGSVFVGRDMLTKNSIFNSSMCIFRKESFYKISSDFTNYKFCGDWLFWIEIALQGDVFISGKVLNYFRKHSGDVTGKAYRHGLHYTEYLQLIESLSRNSVISAGQCKSLMRRKFVEFLKDHRLNVESQKAVTKLFRLKLGLQSYILSARIYLYQLRKGARSFNSYLLL